MIIICNHNSGIIVVEIRKFVIDILIDTAIINKVEIWINAVIDTLIYIVIIATLNDVVIIID